MSSDLVARSLWAALAVLAEIQFACQVNKMLPTTLGANIGTTFTALLAAMAELKHDA